MFSGFHTQTLDPVHNGFIHGLEEHKSIPNCVSIVFSQYLFPTESVPTNVAPIVCNFVSLKKNPHTIDLKQMIDCLQLIS